jgi:hypothetical protein
MNIGGHFKCYFATNNPIEGDNVETLISKALQLQTSSHNDKMLEFFIDNICVVVNGQVFQQFIRIPVGTNCTPVLAVLFSYTCSKACS